MDQIHTPERLENETMTAYRARQRMSKRLSQRGRLLSSGVQLAASPARQARKLAKASVGARQLKKLVRAYRAKASAEATATAEAKEASL